MEAAGNLNFPASLLGERGRRVLVSPFSGDADLLGIRKPAPEVSSRGDGGVGLVPGTLLRLNGIDPWISMCFGGLFGDVTFTRGGDFAAAAEGVEADGCETGGGVATRLLGFGGSGGIRRSDVSEAVR